MISSLLLALALPALATGPRTATAFAFDLLQTVSRQSPKDNILVSPVSARWALGMAYAGSAGDTQLAMAMTLGAADPKTQLAMEKQNAAALMAADPKVVLRAANSLWLKEGYPFKNDYLAAVQDAFSAETFVRPFTPADVAEANAWVSKKTEGKIPSILARLTADDRAVLLNAVYFKGLWKFPFDKKQTRPADFRGPAARQVPMMSRRGSWEYAERPGLQAARLPYGSGRLAMIVLLPAKGKTPADLPLTPQGWGEVRAALRQRPGVVELPRFKVQASAPLNAPLTKMGMGAAFDRLKADFTGMSDSPKPEDRLHISSVLQKTFIEVDEAGTEAAAATAVVMATRGSAKPEEAPFTFTADRPFAYLIEDRDTGELLFAGVLRDPK